jgi:membrane-bound metal-dependent hydrolase YbcI (DUF457 family)
LALARGAFTPTLEAPMFVGHLALSFAARRADRQVSLSWYIVAANLIDLIWPALLIVGVERVRVDPGNTAFTPLAFEHYPWTHSLLMTLVWGIALAGLARLRGIAKPTAMLIGALVVSHWVLDYVTHAPDLLLWPGGAVRLGLGLWNSIPATFVVEFALWVAGIGLFLAARRPSGMQGWVALGSFLLVTTLMWVASPFSPPPPNDEAIEYFSLFGWIIVPWAWWIERTSVARDAG